jgi:hypothetical protein
VNPDSGYELLESSPPPPLAVKEIETVREEVKRPEVYRATTPQKAPPIDFPPTREFIKSQSLQRVSKGTAAAASAASGVAGGEGQMKESLD